MQLVIVSRHAGAIDWLLLRGITGPVIAHATPFDVLGKIAVGVLPLALAAAAEEVWAIDMPYLRPDQRGKDLTPEEMDRAGAILTKYRVERLPEEE